MSNRPPSRLQLAGATALLLASLGVFALRCTGDPAIPFVVQDPDAPWIMFPQAPTGLMGLAERDALPVTSFRRRFAWPDASGGVLRVRALRELTLTLNGEPVDLGPAPPHWRRYRRADLGGRLHPGPNELRVDVKNPTGPALLSLRLEGAAATLVSDGAWQVATPGEAPRPAIPLDTQRINPTSFAMPSPVEGLVLRRDRVLLCLALALLLFAAARSAPGRRLAPRLVAALPLFVIAAWSWLFVSRVLAVPLDVGFDAYHHLDYVTFLRERHALPLASDGWSMFHPPGYYLPTALLVELQAKLSPGSSSLWPWKLVGWLAGLGSALLCWAVARRVFGSGARETAYAAVFAAVLPMNLYLSAYVTNESLHAAASCAVVLASVSLLQAPAPRWRGVAAWAALVALAVLTKYTAWIVACVAGFFLAVRWWRVEQAPVSRIAGRLALAAAIVSLLAGWFYVRQTLHFGQPFPLNVDLPGETRQWWSQPGYYTPAFFLRFGGVLAHPFLAGFHSAWDSLYSTLWGDGQLAGQVIAARRHPYWDWPLMAVGYWLALPATALLGLGAAASLERALRDPDPAVRAVHSFLLTLAWALLLSVLFMTLRQPDYGQAKAFYGLAVMAPLTLFFALGCGAVDRALAGRAVWARALWFGWLGSFTGVLFLSYVG